MKQKAIELLSQFEKISGILEKQKTPISGNLEVLIIQNKFYYRLTYINPKTGKRERKYIPKPRTDFAAALAQQSYNHEVEKFVNCMIPLLKKLLEEIEENKLDAIYENLHPGRKVLVTPIIPTRRQKLAAWKSIDYQGLPFREEDRYFTTNNGEKVRSKSEKILGDKFHHYGIAYKYECPFHHKNRRTLYPDFTFLDTETNQEIYWEHFGRMGDPIYANNALKKINEYASCGIILGERLIVSFESSEIPLDEKSVDLLIQQKLLRN